VPKDRVFESTELLVIAVSIMLGDAERWGDTSAGGSV
jgi:hypothetical protein